MSKDNNKTPNAPEKREKYSHTPPQKTVPPMPPVKPPKK